MKIGRILFGPKVGEPLDPFFDRAILLGIEQAKREQYSSGLRDGMEGVLELILGREHASGIAYGGPVPDELRAWIEAALKRIAEDREKDTA